MLGEKNILNEREIATKVEKQISEFCLVSDVNPINQTRGPYWENNGPRS